MKICLLTANVTRIKSVKISCFFFINFDQFHFKLQTKIRDVWLINFFEKVFKAFWFHPRNFIYLFYDVWAMGWWFRFSSSSWRMFIFWTMPFEPWTKTEESTLRLVKFKKFKSCNGTLLFLSWFYGFISSRNVVGKKQNWRSEKPFVCSTCNKSLSVKSSLSSHIRTIQILDRFRSF